MTVTTTCEVLLDPQEARLKFLPEGPYRSGDGRFSWVSIQHAADQPTGSLNIFDPATNTNRTFDLPGRPGFAYATDRAGVFVVGLERSLGLFDTASGLWTPFCSDIDSGVEDTIINDGVTFDGNLVFGCKHLDFSDRRAGLYLWRRRDQQLCKLRDDQICSNGKAVVDQDGGLTLIDIDTPTKSVVAYPLDVAAGTLGEARTLLDLTAEEFFPDGMILSPDRRSAIIAFYDPRDRPHGEARQYSLETGAIEAVWTTPDSPQVTCPQLIEIGGAVRLVLTTAIEHMTPERQARHVHAGCLFVGETGFESLGDQPVFPVP